MHLCLHEVTAFDFDVTLLDSHHEFFFSQEKSEEEYYVPFPKISHVGYDNTLSQENALLELGKSFKLRPDVDLLEIVNDSLKEPWKNLIDPAVHAPMLNENISWPKCNDSKRQTRYLKKQVMIFTLWNILLISLLFNHVYKS